MMQRKKLKYLSIPKCKDAAGIFTRLYVGSSSSHMNFYAWKTIKLCMATNGERFCRMMCQSHKRRPYTLAKACQWDTQKVYGEINETVNEKSVWLF